MSKENIPEECDYCEYLAKDLYMENFINGPSNPVIYGYVLTVRMVTQVEEETRLLNPWLEC
jgi:hypothetical protein